jgi:hypothetical protein
MASLPGVYRASCVGRTTEGSLVYVPQVFGDVQVLLQQSTSGDLPVPGDSGYVAFEGGVPEIPVWL